MSDTQRFEKALSAVTDALAAAPPALGSVLRRVARAGTNDSDDIREIALFCKVLAAEMQDGEIKAYLTRFQAVLEECAEAWDGNEKEAEAAVAQQLWHRPSSPSAAFRAFIDGGGRFGRRPGAMRGR